MTRNLYIVEDDASDIAGALVYTDDERNEIIVGLQPRFALSEEDAPERWELIRFIYKRDHTTAPVLQATVTLAQLDENLNVVQYKKASELPVAGNHAIGSARLLAQQVEERLKHGTLASVK